MLTRKTINEMHRPVYAADYCDLYFLLDYSTDIGYNSGVHGMNYRVHLVDDVIITTGYRPIGTRINHELCKKYNEEARQLAHADLPYTVKRDRYRALREQLIDELPEV